MKSNKSSSSSSASATVQANLDDLRALLREAESALADAGEGATDKVKELRARLSAALDDTKSMLNRARESASEQIERADEYVRVHPYHAIGVAAAIGAIAGLLLGRRCG